MRIILLGIDLLYRLAMRAIPWLITIRLILCAACNTRLYWYDVLLILFYMFVVRQRDNRF
jgi:hypothetical protein